MSTELKYTDHGGCKLPGCNDMNIPVNSFIHEPDEDCKQWRWTADNFMPRKGYITEGEYDVRADDRETLVALVNAHVVPLYEAALRNLKAKGENYYWEVQP